MVPSYTYWFCLAILIGNVVPKNMLPSFLNLTIDAAGQTFSVKMQPRNDIKGPSYPCTTVKPVLAAIGASALHS